VREKQKREREAQVLKQRREERRGAAATVAATAAKLKRRTDEDANITKDKVKTSRIVARALMFKFFLTLLKDM
jgi:hypothetical protein